MAIPSWSIGTTIGRWKGFGPYYAMFPVEFARTQIERYSKPGSTIIDPFCGRGTSNYVAKALSRNSIGCDVNPVAWVYAKTKTDPCRNKSLLVKRLEEIREGIVARDFSPENEFQATAWSRDVLAFLNSARRQLNWRSSKTDRTLAALILVYLHGKYGTALSNQMRQSKSMAPDYSVRWWRKNKMQPPALDPVAFIKERIIWRYAKGFIQNNVKAIVMLGEAQKTLTRLSEPEADLLVTSPPYMGITNYEYDNWIRLWALGGPHLPNGDQKQRYSNKEGYKKMLREVFEASKRILSERAVIIARTDNRQFTLDATATVLGELWPNHAFLGRRDSAKKHTQTALFGDKSQKPGEVDLLLLPNRMRCPSGFAMIEKITRFGNA